MTIAQVADAAGVAKMTVTNYFPRKEDLVFDRAEAVIRHLADVVAARAPGESMLAAIRRDYAEAVARADVTLGLSSPAFARMIAGSPVLTSRVLEMLDLRERALGDAIAAETGTDGPQQRLVAALLASVHRVLYAEASQRSLAGQPRAGDLRRAGRRPPPARSTCWSRPWAATASGPSRRSGPRRAVRLRPGQGSVAGAGPGGAARPGGRRPVRVGILGSRATAGQRCSDLGAEPGRGVPRRHPRDPRVSR